MNLPVGAIGEKGRRYKLIAAAYTFSVTFTRKELLGVFVLWLYVE